MPNKSRIIAAYMIKQYAELHSEIISPEFANSRYAKVCLEEGEYVTENHPQARQRGTKFETENLSKEKTAEYESIVKAAKNLVVSRKEILAYNDAFTKYFGGKRSALPKPPKARMAKPPLLRRPRPRH